MSGKRDRDRERASATGPSGQGRSGQGHSKQGPSGQSRSGQSGSGRVGPGQGGAVREHPARALLDELATVLTEERAALVRLDRTAIEGFASRKLELDQELTKTVAAHPLGASEKELLESVRNRALDNQLLLAHARSCVQGVLSLLAPKNTPRYTAPGHTAPSAHSAPDAPPLALNLRR